MEFPRGIKEYVEIPGVNEKRSGISSSDQEELMWNFHRSWFFALEFPRGATQLCGISKGEVLLSLEFPRVSDKSKNSRGSLEHEFFSFAKIKSILNVFKHQHLHITCW